MPPRQPTAPAAPKTNDTPVVPAHGAWDPVTLEYEVEAVAYPTWPACAFCSRPGEHPPCCDDHDRPMCHTCKDTSGSYRHSDPAEIFR